MTCHSSTRHLLLPWVHSNQEHLILEWQAAMHLVTLLADSELDNTFFKIIKGAQTMKCKL